MKRQGFTQHSVFRGVVRPIAKANLAARTAARLSAFVLAVVGFMPVGRTQDVTFNKTRYSSVKQPKEFDVALTISDSKLLIKGRKENGINFEIPYSSIDSMSYEVAARHRIAEGAPMLALSPATGVILMATKTKSHWLDIQYRNGDTKETTVLRLDKSEYQQVISTLEARTGKHIEVLNAKTSPLNPVANSKDIDQVVPFRMDAVAAALKPAMESLGCKVTEAKERKVECKRERGGSERTGFGGEKVTAQLEAKDDQTRVRIWTGKGVVGRLGKNNWSTPIYQEMLKALQKPAESAPARAN